MTCCGIKVEVKNILKEIPKLTHPWSTGYHYFDLKDQIISSTAIFTYYYEQVKCLYQVPLAFLVYFYRDTSEYEAMEFTVK